MKSSNRVILNTGILYGRMILTMGITLYSTRLVLVGLGSGDYGIFNLLAGIIAMLSFLNVAMSTSTQRFLSVNQGSNDIEMQKKVFANSLILHIIIGLIIVLVLESLSFFLFNGFLKIPPDRLLAAKFVFHFMSATVFFTIIETPFTGTLNAHESILFLAIVSTIEVLLKLGLAISLFHIDNFDRLIVYGFFNPCIVVVSFVLYATCCLIKYKEASLRNWHLANKKTMKALASFAGWNLFGSLCALSKTQGMALLLNIFFGTVVNAAYGIANQIAAQLNFLSATILQAMNPQIMKSHGSGDIDRMLRLSMIASKFSFFLMAMVSIPCIFEMKSILTVWLKFVPANTVIFCNLILISILISQLTIGLQSSIQATGKIKAYQMVVGTVVLLNVPIAYIFLKSGLPAHMAIVTFSIIEVIACILRLYFAKKVTGLPITRYVNRVIFKELFSTVVVILFCYVSTTYLDFKYRFLFTGVISSLIFFISFYFTGLYEDEKLIINNLFASVLKKVQNKTALAS